MSQDQEYEKVRTPGTARAVLTKVCLGLTPRLEAAFSQC